MERLMVELMSPTSTNPPSQSLRLSGQNLIAKSQLTLLQIVDVMDAIQGFTSVAGRSTTKFLMLENSHGIKRHQLRSQEYEYRDSGEIQSSGFNALAPPVESSKIFGSLLWDRGDLVVSAGIGFPESDHDALSEDNEFFGNLYKNRGWLSLRTQHRTK